MPDGNVGRRIVSAQPTAVGEDAGVLAVREKARLKIIFRTHAADHVLELVNNGRLAVNYERRNPGMFCDTRATLHDGSIVLSFQGNRDQIVTLATLTRPLTADGISCTKAYFESETGFNVLEFART